MDEPSIGLDPASRNNLWSVLKKAKQDRAIILTSSLSLSLSLSLNPKKKKKKPIIADVVSFRHLELQFYRLVND